MTNRVRRFFGPEERKMLRFTKIPDELWKVLEDLATDADKDPLQILHFLIKAGITISYHKQKMPKGKLIMRGPRGREVVVKLPPV